MTPHVDDWLPEYASGTLPEELVTEVDTHLGRCRRCKLELAAIDEVYNALPLDLDPPPAPLWLRERILSDVARENRFEQFCARVAKLIDVAKEKARDLLGKIDSPEVWVKGPAVSRLFHLPGGAAVAGANCGFVHMAAGETFPQHTHLGEELVLVLQGGFIDSDGKIYRRGDEAWKPAGSEHHFTALDGPDLIYLVVLHGGLVIPSLPDFEL